MLMLALRLILKEKGGKQYCLPFVGFNLGVEIFLKKRKHQKKGALKQKIKAPLYTLHWDFKKILCKACLRFYCFFLIKRILKALFFFIPWLLTFSDLSSYGLNSSKRYTVRLLSVCLRRSTLLSGVNPLRFPLQFP